MIKVTVSDFKKNFDKYMASLVKEEIIIIQDGVSIDRIVFPEKESIVSKLRGILPDDGYSIEDAKRDRLSNKRNC